MLYLLYLVNINTEMPKFLSGTILGLSGNDWNTEITAAFNSITMKTEYTSGVNLNTITSGGGASLTAGAYAQVSYDYSLTSGMPPALI